MANYPARWFALWRLYPISDISVDFENPSILLSIQYVVTDPYSESVTHPKGTHTAVNTHTVNTHPEQWAAIYAAAPREQLGIRCLAQGHLSHGIEGEESAVHSLSPTTIPTGPRLELATFGLRV